MWIGLELFEVHDSPVYGFLRLVYSGASAFSPLGISEEFLNPVPQAKSFMPIFQSKPF